jgi:hypothetical protein
LQNSGETRRENADAYLIVVPALSRDPYSAGRLILRANNNARSDGSGLKAGTTKEGHGDVVALLFET